MCCNVHSKSQILQPTLISQFIETYQTPANELWVKGRSFVQAASVSTMGRMRPAGRVFNMPDRDDLVILTNSHAQAKSVLYSREQRAGGIGIHGNANEKDYIYFKREWAIFTRSGWSLKLAEKFKYLNKNIATTESHVNIQ